MIKLISITQPLIEGIKTPNELIAYAARVSSPQNQLNTETADKLLRYCLKHKHFSIFEQVSCGFEIETTRDIGRQILRHKSFSFQEFCLHGDTEIYFDLPSDLSRGNRQLYKISISKLSKNWNKSEFHRNQIKKMNIRVWDEHSKRITNAHIGEVFETGEKEIYEIELFNGKKIKTTKEHLFLTPDGFLSLSEYVGLDKTANGTAFITNKDGYLGCNGIPIHQSKDWLFEKKKESIENKGGVMWIAKEANVSYHTIRKWLKIHKIQFSKKESSYNGAWNKGKSGYSWGKHSKDTILRMRDKARKGEDSNLWKGGVNRAERLKIADWCSSIRSLKLIEANYQCKHCSSTIDLELDHIEPVSKNQNLAYDYDNIQVLCSKCHDEKHGLAGDAKTWRQKHKGNTLTVSWSKIKSVKYIGIEQTYDLFIDHSSHNYVANGIVVHNSGRYSQMPEEPIFRECRLQDKKNRQSSILSGFGKENDLWNKLQDDIWHSSYEAYKNALDAGIAKEQARALLPEGMVKTRMYITGPLRSFLTWIMVRAGKETQKEHRKIAKSAAKILEEHFPFLKEVFEPIYDENYSAESNA